VAALDADAAEALLRALADEYPAPACAAALLAAAAALTLALGDDARAAELVNRASEAARAAGRPDRELEVDLVVRGARAARRGEATEALRIALRARGLAEVVRSDEGRRRADLL